MSGSPKTAFRTFFVPNSRVIVPVQTLDFFHELQTEIVCYLCAMLLPEAHIVVRFCGDSFRRSSPETERLAALSKITCLAQRLMPVMHVVLRKPENLQGL